MKASLKRRLPGYMIPQQVVLLNRLPTLLNGKINYKALPEPTRKTNTTTFSSKRQYKNEMERQLHSIWKEILGYEELTITDNFFEVGGNSLLAMRLMAKIKSKIGIAIPLIHLFQCPTVKELSRVLSCSDVKKSASHIILMREGGEKKPFFCVHPVGGNVLCYRALAKYWVDDRPFYAIQAHGLEEGENPYNSIEEMAKEYIKSMKKIQASGPYILGGWSFGGLIAAEMTNQLRKEGEEVSLLVLIDTTANIDKFKAINVEDDSLLLSELTHHFIASPNEQKSRLSFKEKFIRFIENGGKTTIKNDHTSVDRLIALAKTNYRALQAFSVPNIDVRVALIRTQENPEKTKSLGWNKYATKLKIFHAPGDHWAITQDDLASHYSQILQSCFGSLVKEEALSTV